MKKINNFKGIFRMSWWSKYIFDHKHINEREIPLWLPAIKVINEVSSPKLIFKSLKKTLSTRILKGTCFFNYFQNKNENNVLIRLSNKSHIFINQLVLEKGYSRFRIVWLTYAYGHDLNNKPYFRIWRKFWHPGKFFIRNIIFQWISLILVLLL